MAAPPPSIPAGSTPSAAASPPGLMLKLSLMMFLQFFIWGAWFELGFPYVQGLKFTELENGLVFGAFNIGALVALFFSTQLADRKFAAEKFLSFSHLIGGAAILGLFFLQAPVGTNVGEFNSATLVARGSVETTGLGKMTDGKIVILTQVTTTENAEKFWTTFEKLEADKQPTVTFVYTKLSDGVIVGNVATPLAPFWPFFLLMLLHSVFYVPTISIANSIAFAAFSNPSKQFGPVRLWGTIGWIVASWPFIFILADWASVNETGKSGLDKIGEAMGTPLGGAAGLAAKRYIFLVAGVASFVLAAFSLTLPHTPPKPAAAGDSFAWVKALKLLKHPFILVLFIVTFIDAAVHQSYFFWTGGFLETKVGIPSNWVGATMKLGQVAEILTMLTLGWVLKSFGWRTTMIVGVLGHAARFAVFAFFPQQLPVIAVILLHGVCYAFFFATVYIFVDKYFPKDVRSSAQGLFNVLILGVGPFVANFACGQLANTYKIGEAINYPPVFEYSMFAAILGAVLLGLFFHPPKDEVKG